MLFYTFSSSLGMFPTKHFNFGKGQNANNTFIIVGDYKDCFLNFTQQQQTVNENVHQTLTTCPISSYM